MSAGHARLTYMSSAPASAPTTRRRVRATQQTWMAASAAVVFVVSALLFSFSPIPYVVWAPNDSHDIMSTIEVDGQQRPIIDVEGIPVHTTTGRLDLATIAESSPDALVSLPEALLAHWLPRRDVLPRDLIYPPGLTASQLQQEGNEEMSTSQHEAAVAALRAGGYAIRALPMITTVISPGPAHGLLQPRDFILAVDSVSVTSVEQIRAAIRRHSVGDTVTITYLREGVEGHTAVKLVRSNQEDSTPVLGAKFEMGFSHPGRIQFRADSAIGGPSGGLAFALGLYDRITPSDLLRGRHVSATGTISSKGEVGTIGGVQEKIGAAEDAGASIMLIPRGNCADLAGLPHKIRIVPVRTLKEGISALEMLSDPKTAQGVPTCP